MRNTDDDFIKVSFNTDLITCGIFRLFYVDKTTEAAQEQCVQDFCVSNQQSARLPLLEIFNMHTDVDAIDCKRGLYEHRNRVCTESCLWEKNPFAAQGNPTCVSIAFASSFRCFSYQLRYTTPSLIQHSQDCTLSPLTTADIPGHQ